MVPKRLQAVLWSAGTGKLDVVKDKHYIIHQVLAYGSWEDTKWLFKTYDQETIKNEFVDYPEKDYRPATFNFIKNHLLGLEYLQLNQSRYDPTTPRVIG
ncbi:MAG: Uncharacterized protein G01um101416_836 [Microgenomates group bacterium Gr01-1014_16]|nr:MAG: Uncharacterized protein G01um101416_836 [Microgenomates group bacterium Gr01-1014_16]